MRNSLTFFAGFALLAACNGGEDSAVVEINEAPVAEAGADIAQSADEAVELDGSASTDPDGDALSYSWSFEYVPDGSELGEAEDAFKANDAPSAITTGFIPDAVGTYVVALRVNDGEKWSAYDYVVVEISAPEDYPIADAGPDQYGEKEVTVTLDGSNSYDPKGRPIETYAWTMAGEAPQHSVLTADDIVSADQAVATFTPDALGVYTFALSVCNDLDVCSVTSDAVVITVVGDDGSPVANAGADIEGADCSNHELDGSASTDPENDALQYFWDVQSRPAGSSATNDNFSDNTVASPTFWGDAAGAYVLSLSVYDGTQWSTPDLVALTLTDRETNEAPVVNIPTPSEIDAGQACCEPSGYVFNCDDCSDQSMSIGSDVTVTDGDGDPMTYLWELTSGSGTFSDATELEGTVTLEDIEPVEPGLCETNEHVLKLTVTDCTGVSTEAEVTVSSSCCGVSEDTGAICTD
jgi:hypothetical protein